MKNPIKTIEDYINLPTIKANYRIAYGTHPEQFGDLYLPQTGKHHPVIILLHGGCWRAEFGLSALGQLSKSLTKLGFAVWNLEFRRLGNGGGWPVTFEDVALGADKLKKIADTHSLDLSNVTTMGHSAGGHLALWLAGRHHLPAESHLRSFAPLSIHHVVSLAGIPDLNTGVSGNICRGACQELAGGLPNDIPDIYLQASPHNLLPFNIPQWHLVGEQDPIVPVKHLKTYVETAQQYEPAHLVVIPDIGHFEMIMPNTISWKYIKKALS